jgi:hypothetical protein
MNPYRPEPPPPFKYDQGPVLFRTLTGVWGLIAVYFTVVSCIHWLVEGWKPWQAFWLLEHLLMATPVVIPIFWVVSRKVGKMG